MIVGLVRALIAGIACACVLLGCGRTPPEARLRETIDASQQYLATRDAASLSDVVAEDFVGPDGMDCAGLRRMAQAAFLRYRAIGVNLGPMQVDMADGGRHATVRFTAALTGGDGALLPESARLYAVESGWREGDGGAWELTSLRWEGTK
ncbi:nuclear transport factor 2 family protein [Aerolutibacter ruishenii]|uniref:nuclear transport factor 2 family protein n=1 Tax=Aerolutibacter ruishenii TaxID=686800 RepID=UPI0011A2C924|nr:nuclear transport factor 2 family protein [Lysobacter ruishenii]